MDPRIKNAAIILAVLFVGLPVVSRVWNGWMDQTQQDMIDNQAKMQAHARGLSQEANRAETISVVRERCEPVLVSGACAGRQPISGLRDCLYELTMRRCDALPEINYCAIVDQIRDCSDPFEDQQKNGCDRMRELANCGGAPAPRDRTGLWRIDLR